MFTKAELPQHRHWHEAVVHRQDLVQEEQDWAQGIEKVVGGSTPSQREHGPFYTLLLLCWAVAPITACVAMQQQQNPRTHLTGSQ